MGYLNQIVEFCTFADPRTTECGTVHSGIGTDLHIIFNHHHSGLGYFFVGTVVAWSKTETVRTNHSSAVNDTPRTYPATFVNPYSGAYHSTIADLDIVADIRLRVYHHTFAETHAFADVGERADIGLIGNINPLSNVTRLFHAPLARLAGLDGVK